jgi:hypothetical protein
LYKTCTARQSTSGSSLSLLDYSFSLVSPYVLLIVFLCSVLPIISVFSAKLSRYVRSPYFLCIFSTLSAYVLLIFCIVSPYFPYCISLFSPYYLPSLSFIPILSTGSPLFSRFSLYFLPNFSPLLPIISLCSLYRKLWSLTQSNRCRNGPVCAIDSKESSLAALSLSAAPAWHSEISRLCSAEESACRRYHSYIILYLFVIKGMHEIN